MTNSLDSLANLATATQMAPAQIASAIGGVSSATIQTWIDGTARPGTETAHVLQAWLIALRHTLNQNRRLGAARDAQLAGLIVALQTPTERKLWIAKRAQMRRQFAR